MTYVEQLRDERWLSRRLDILNLDGYKCRYCKRTRNLNVHHTYYVKNRMAWEYPDSAMITLCIDCHEIAHEKIKAFKQKRSIKQNEDPKHISKIYDELLENLVNG